MDDRTEVKPLSDEVIRELIGRIDRYHGNELKHRKEQSIRDEVQCIRGFLRENGGA